MLDFTDYLRKTTFVEKWLNFLLFKNSVLIENLRANLMAPKSYQCCPTLAPVRGPYSLIESATRHTGKGNAEARSAETWKPNVTTSLEGYIMKLFKFAKNFARDEDGAVTVDWVVLTAAIVGLGIAVLTTVGGGVMDLGNAIGTDLSETNTTDWGSLTGADADASAD
jgi:Flp pilus assembly pilin Flp